MSEGATRDAPDRDEPLSAQLDRAFDYRGYVTLHRIDGTSLTGYVFNRGPGYLELFDESAAHKLQVPVAEIAGVSFSGEDATRKSMEIWERRRGSLEPRETSAWGQWQESRPVLLVVGLERELRAVSRSLGVPQRAGKVRARLGDTDLVACAVGMGGGSRAMVMDERPRLLLSCGFSGALEAALLPGDVVLATAVRDENGEVIEAPERQRRAAAQALAGRRVFEGELTCVTELAASPGEKRRLSRPGALAVDMESHPAARAAAEAGVPWVGMRVIVDTLDASLPRFAREPEEQHLPGALRHALSGPRAVGELIRLGSAATRASRSLTAALHLVLPALLAVGEAR